MYIGLIVILFSCKSNSIAQEKEKKSSQNAKIEKPKFGDPNDNELTKLKEVPNNQIPPNTVHLSVIVLEVSEDKAICNITNTTSIKVRIKQVIGSGSGIVNMVSSNQEIILGLRQNTLKYITSLKTKLNKEIFIIVKEKPCSNFSQTLYEIISFESKN